MGHSNCHFLWRRLEGWTCAASPLICGASAPNWVRAEGQELSARGCVSDPPWCGFKCQCEPRKQRDGWQAGCWQTHNVLLDGQMPASPLARFPHYPPGTLTFLLGTTGDSVPGGCHCHWSTCLWPVRDCPHAHWHQTDPHVSAWPVRVFSSGSGCTGDPVVMQRWKCHHWSCLGMFLWSYSVTRC